MGKRTASELEEEVVVESGKKSKKDKKDKKDKKSSRDEPLAAEEVVEEPVVVEEETEPVVAEFKKISEDDFDLKKAVFSKWLKEEKEM